MKKVAFYTVISDLFAEQGRMMLHSLKLFHPDIPVIVFGEDYMKEMDKESYELNGFLKTPTRFSKAGLQISKEYELIIRIDADCIVCGPLDEVLEGDYEVAAAMEWGNPYDPSYFLHEVKPYLSSGFFACKSQRFWEHWHYLNTHYYKTFPINIDNDTFNIAFHYGMYKTKVLDVAGSGVYYGSSSNALFPNYILSGENIYCNGRQVKLIHRAGGSRRDFLGTKETSYKNIGFSQAVIRRLEELTGGLV